MYCIFQLDFSAGMYTRAFHSFSSALYNTNYAPLKINVHVIHKSHLRAAFTKFSLTISTSHVSLHVFPPETNWTFSSVSPEAKNNRDLFFFLRVNVHRRNSDTIVLSRKQQCAYKNIFLFLLSCHSLSHGH